MPFVHADLEIKPYDEDEDFCTDILDTWCLWDTGVQTSMILSQMLSKEARGRRRVMSPLYQVCAPPPFQGFACKTFLVRFAGTSQQIEISVGFRQTYQTVPISLL
jgi:hypothetical protein